MGKLTALYTKWGIPSVGAFFILEMFHSWHQMIPWVGTLSHAQHMAFGIGVLFAWATAWIAMRK